MPRAPREARTPTDIPVEIVAADGGRIAGRATNVSLGGARVETPFALAFGTRVVVHLPLPGALRPAFVPGVVRWTAPGAMGLQFGLLGVRETHLIAQLANPLAQVLDGRDVAWVG